MTTNIAQITPSVAIGGDQLTLIGGPCAVEAEPLCLAIAQELRTLCAELGIAYIFKASYDKANRTSGSSFRGLGMGQALEILARVKEQVGVPILTDVHEVAQVEPVARVADVLQVPAFLCRQTDLLVACGASGRAVNVKKGQFMAPLDMRYAVEKVRGAGARSVCLTERGATFGYHNLVVDFRSLPIMRQFAPVVFDVTHSVQMPGAAGGSSGGNREFAPYLARAAAGAGVDAFFIETHPEPARALSDGATSVPLAEMRAFLTMLRDVWLLCRPFGTPLSP